MPDIRLRASPVGILLCLFLLDGCEQPPAPGAGAQHRQEPATLQAPAATSSPETPPPAAAPPEKSAAAVKAAVTTPTLESLVLTPEDKPFGEEPANRFGEVPDWLATQPRSSPPGRLLPDLFEDTASQGRVNVEGELLLDGTRKTSSMVDGVGMKIEISTDD